ncbi:hypothetical protein N0V83_010176 [Neocucurbitaria cava]|uniref:Uncharacterized protein n=1 Tax=Neocucurbitaria cava TaxID=798079 RepID=A0A9W9CHW2_9PLEO|nr:hypothetical protein N0V83_010176 [Neocucurbitaria cava]
MDTEFPLPVPMHRPFITLDPQYDEPLPFRRALKKVTELNAENAIPYKLPKSRPMSRLELLPLEIRQRIYAYVGFDPRYWRYEGIEYESWRGSFTNYISCACSTRRSCLSTRSWLERDWKIRSRYEINLLHINHGLRAEFLDLMLRGQTVKFKPILRNEWFDEVESMSHSERHNYWSSAWTAKSLECWTFEFLRHIRIKEDRTWHTGEKARCYAFRKHLRTICCIAKHCPLLISLYATLTTRCCRKKEFKYVESIAIVYGELAQKCRDLEDVGIMLHVERFCTHRNHRYDHWSYSDHDADVELQLKAVPDFSRQELMETWVRTSIREHLKKLETLYK